MKEIKKLRAIQNRDSLNDGKFTFDVETTKIICRSGRPARVPLEKNIVFFNTMAEAIEKSCALAKAAGFIRSERFPSLAAEGKLLSMSAWENEDCVSKWRNLASHRMTQKDCRINDIADCEVTVVTPVRTYTMTGRTEAPADSNKCWEV
ncbi:Ada metal-binding domain-containing protein [Eisenbergiella sp.]